MKFYKKAGSMASIFLMSWFMLMLNYSMFLIYYNKSVLLEMVFFEVHSVNINIPIIFDWSSTMFSFIVCFISFCVMIFSMSYMSGDIFISRFIFIVMLFVLSMNFLIFIPNLVSLLLGWDGLGLVSFCLVIYYQNYKSLGAGLMTAFMNRIGDVGILMSVGWMFSQGHWDSAFMWDFNFCNFSIMMIVIAGMTKSAQIPFCSWLPAAMAAPTPVSALVHSSTLVTAGVFLLVRFFYFLDTLWLFKPFILSISVMTMLMAGIAANYEMDLKKVIALSTLSQLGVMMFSIGLGLPIFALMHLFTHALFKALLFLCAGGIIHLHFNNQDVRKMSQLWIQLPVSSTCFNIANLALCGVPFFAGFYSKDFIIEMMILNQMNLFLGILVFLATSLTVAYSVRLSVHIFWNNMTQPVFICSSDEDFYIILPILILTMGAIFGGSVLSWVLLSPVCSPFLNLFDKLLTLFIVLSSGLISFLLFNIMKIKKKSVYFDFFSYMWFMSILSNNFVSLKTLSLSFLLFKVLDSNWLEILGGEGLISILSFSSKKNQYNQKNLFNSLLGLSLLGIFFIPSFIFLFN
uniref:NADH-ubiquinone oxidoreductase chain 5 n=1 Tax=Sypharochiton sinclairi TaxID=1117399 RepID=A0A059UAI5_9MOLL|nr:NADH dehydrogenase subunit 5 [Sypharochiton sinclairi]AHZ60665.1 NADH dehydrogenase subunit 5 [Sypharochiton sinclairi]